MSADDLEQLMHECIQSGPGLQSKRFEEIGRVLAHELGSGPSDGMEELFSALLKHRRQREAALLIVPLDWAISIGADPNGRCAASIRAPCQTSPISAIADSEGPAILAALLGAIIAGPSESPDTQNPQAMLSGGPPLMPFQQRTPAEGTSLD